MTLQNDLLKTEDELLAAKLKDAESPTFMVSVDPDEAETLGAFEEDALTEQEALESAIDNR